MTTYKWPDSLKLDPGAKRALEKVPQEHPMLGAWPEDQKFRTADDVEAIAGVLIPEFHKELAKANIAYVMKEKSTSRGPAPGAKASKFGALERFLTGIDFAVVVLWESWHTMDLVTRVAMVDHFLERCNVDDNENFVIMKPDVQEFNCIVNRWGPWQDNLGAFLRAAQQTDMFAEPPPEPQPATEPVEAREPVGAGAG